ncbi:MAG: hypothetical protein ACRDLS_16665 [Solirubrobacteraceae bacterium]
MLDELVAADPCLAVSATQVARTRLCEVVVDDIAAAVADALLALDQEDLAARAGPTRYGYVEPTEAAWQLLEEALEPWLQDIARRAALGLVDASVDIACGVVLGLRSVDGCDNDERLLSWVPDFPAEATESVRRALSKAGVGVGDPRLERTLRTDGY